mmetsp:Transcript_28122/g.94727  ORF Transcript_28122/g.94727 Transcript_28122/m.94727 type:complete len:123 (+) Transcript_28122:65-433(+)|eukprot:CAMPEP_0184087572 /NCGR_PEP_ID=MMETSP0974-20121125/5787_1 /TAXON_ID=483370 /ORGANISM="non described non described, Strain CCMP2097" /LENGTH=122 /DNA_ID=CAMNT_0026390275 /DNA_START=69 /DNA_END=437 /DNA_ORIENTATION=-
MSDGYNFKKTTIQENKLADWLRVPVTSDLQQIPGIGPANEIKLKDGTGDDVVETCHQLIGKFLSFKGTGVTSKEHCDAFYYWLQAKGVNSGRNNVVLAIAEKTELFFPGTYDPSVYNDAAEQ